MSIQQVLDSVQGNGFSTVLVSGGEPLLKGEVVDLMTALLADERTVLLETSGVLGNDKLVPLDQVPEGVHRIVDLKAPGSCIPGEDIDWAGISGLGKGDEIKIVCRDRTDYEWGRELVRAGDKVPSETLVTFSPVQGELRPADLAEWILDDRLDACFLLQLHRVVWPEIERGV